MKKISSILAILFLSLAFSGCSQKETPAPNNMDNNQSVSPTSSHLNVDSSATSSNRVLPGQKDLYQQYKEAIIKTNYGDITVEFFGDDSPITVNNFMNLASTGFYNNTKFHRVIADFMIQGGDPNSKGKDLSSYGTGGPGYKFNDEFNSHKLVRGSLAMANSGPNTNGSQFFIVTKEATPWLDGVHTNFGRVISGMKVVDKIESLDTNEAGLPSKDAIIKSIELK
jgi:peptidyl-prolyl cis-trans isomerase B (cyclophilin B)